MKKVLAISGSTRAKSINQSFIEAIRNIAQTQFSVSIYRGLSDIPHFNPDLDNENPPAQVKEFRRQLQEADGILICTPEYAMGVPGTLKNAIDWSVSTCDFSHKPVALITASLSGEKAHQSLLGTLKIIESNITDGTQLLIPFAKTKIDKDCKITDAETLTQITKLIEAFSRNMENQ
jgi:chromate reductase